MQLMQGPACGQPGNQSGPPEALVLLELAVAHSLTILGQMPIVQPQDVLPQPLCYLKAGQRAQPAASMLTSSRESFVADSRQASQGEAAFLLLSL